MTSFRIIAHRGFSSQYPENTLAAMDAAFREGQADAVEFDIQMSRDQIPVVIHDATLGRTTDSRGRVNQLNLNDLLKLDAGYIFKHTTRRTFFPFRKQGLQIPTLEEVLIRFAPQRLFIEIKNPSPVLSLRIIELLRKYNAIPGAILGSFHHSVVKEIEWLAPDAKRFLSRQEIITLYQAFKKKKPWRKKAISKYLVASMPLRWNALKLDQPDWIEFLKKEGIEIYYWTIDDLKKAKALKKSGVAGIITNVPERISVG